jgi:hypothetical protein
MGRILTGGWPDRPVARFHSRAFDRLRPIPSTLLLHGSLLGGILVPESFESLMM